MGRNIDPKQILDKVLTAYSNVVNDEIAVGQSLTTTVSAVLIEGRGWVDYADVKNGNGAGFSNTDTQCTVYIDGNILINVSLPITYYHNPIIGLVFGDGTYPAFTQPILFNESFEVRLASLNAEASYSLNLAISYGTVN